MKTKEEIEQLALLKYPKFSSDPYNPEQDDDYYERLIWIEVYTQCQNDMLQDQTVTRFEVIDENGRVYVAKDCKVELSYQDDGRTLKVFIKAINT